MNRELERRYTIRYSGPDHRMFVELKADVEEWMAVTDGNSCWEVYPNEQGTLFVGHYSGTTCGSTTKMVQVSRTGEQVDLSGRRKDGRRDWVGG